MPRGLYSASSNSYFSRPHVEDFLERGSDPRPVLEGTMTPLSWLISIWGVLTAILAVLLIYRGTLSMHEEDQLFLSDPDSPRHKEQEELLDKMNKLRPMLKVFGTASGVMVLAIGGLFVYQNLSAVQ